MESVLVQGQVLWVRGHQFPVTPHAGKACSGLLRAGCWKRVEEVSGVGGGKGKHAGRRSSKGVRPRRHGRAPPAPAAEIGARCV